jgi:hypothetical protein
MQASISSLQTVPNPDRRLLGGWRIRLFRGATLLATEDRANQGPVTFTFSVTPASYTASAVRLDNFSAPMGPEVVSSPLVVEGPDTFEAPLTVTLSL